MNGKHRIKRQLARSVLSQSVCACLIEVPPKYFRVATYSFSFVSMCERPCVSRFTERRPCHFEFGNPFFSSETLGEIHQARNTAYIRPSMEVIISIKLCWRLKADVLTVQKSRIGARNNSVPK